MTALTIDPIDKLHKDLRDASATLTPQEARYLVDYYYIQQEDRKRAHNQVRALSEDGEPEPHAIVLWMADQATRFETEIAKALGSYANSVPLGQWSQSIKGIGPVISAGLLAHIDIAKAPTVGHIWRFAGLDPTLEWNKGEKRPFNAKLKTLCWKLGESFVKVSNNDDDVYGHIYAKRKELETERNEAGQYSGQAQAKLLKFKIGKDTDAYKAYSQGKLPPAHVHARAKRYAVKLFLASYHEVGHYLMYGILPPKPYILTQPGHTHQFFAPNAGTVPGLREAQEASRPSQATGEHHYIRA